MRHDPIHFSEKNADLIAFNLYRGGSTNAPQRERMKRILSRAIIRELTDRQRQCLTMYYYEGMTMCEIARVLRVAPSTVTRHIKAAKVRLRHIAEYYVK